MFGCTSDWWIIRNVAVSIHILIVAVFFADHDVVGKIDLDGTIYEMSVFILSPFLTHFARPIIDLIHNVLVLGAFRATPNNIFFVRLFIDGGIVAIGFALLLSFLQLDEFLLQVFPFLLDLSHGLVRSGLTSKSCEYLFS